VKIDRTKLKSAAREARRIALWPLILWIAYLILSLVFDAVTEGRGLVSPDDLSFGLLFLGAAVLSLRIVALFILPAVVVYGVSKRLLRTRE
jgi:hypothetical protein